MNINDAQAVWIYLNIMKDKQETKEDAYEFMNWIKWFINPELAQKYESVSEQTVDSGEDGFIQAIIDDMADQGATEEDIKSKLKSLGLWDEDQEE